MTGSRSAPWITLLLVLVLGLFAIAWAPEPKFGGGVNAADGLSSTGFLDRTVSVAGRTRRYQGYVPFAWTIDKKWPVILYLHGAGERGVDGLQQTQIGLGTAIRLQATRWTFIVVMPQCDASSSWNDAQSEAVALKALDQSQQEFNGDAHRVYLTGISMGGYGVWSIASRHPDLFAAIAPVCGGAHGFVPDRYAEIAKEVQHLPIWIFHGEADDIIPVSESREMNNTLSSLGAEVRYTEYPSVAHNCWDEAYSESELPRWFLSHWKK